MADLERISWIGARVAATGEGPTAEEWDEHFAIPWKRQHESPEEWTRILEAYGRGRHEMLGTETGNMMIPKRPPAGPTTNRRYVGPLPGDV